MNEKEFSDALKKIEREQRWAEWQKAAEEYGDTKLGTREEYIARFRQNPGLEKKYCPALNDRFGCDLKIEKDKITEATMRSAAADEKSATAAETANRRAWLSWGPAALAAILLFAAFCRGCVDTRRNNRSDNVPTETSETVNTHEEGTD